MRNDHDGGGRAGAISGRGPSYRLFSVGFTTVAMGRLAARIPRQNPLICVLKRGTVVLGAGAQGSLG